MKISKAKTFFITLLFLVLLTGGGCGGKKKGPSPPRIVSQASEAMKRGNLWYQRGCLEKASGYYSRANEMYTLSDNLKGVADSMNNLGNIYRRRGEIASALMFYNGALEIYRETNNHREEVRTLSNQAAALTHGGFYRQAHEMIRIAGEKAQKNRVAYPPLTVNLGIVLTRLKHYDQAEEVLKSLFENAPLLEDPVKALANSAMGNLMAETGNHREAALYFTRALEADRREGYSKGIADDLFGAGSAYLSMGEMEKAAYLLERCLKIYTLLQETQNAEKAKKKLDASRLKMGLPPNKKGLTPQLLEQWNSGALFYEPCN